MLRVKDDKHCTEESSVPIPLIQAEPLWLLRVHFDYDNLIYMNFTSQDGVKASSLPDVLPPRLQILLFDKNAVPSLPPLPATLRMLSGRSNKISSLPDMSHCVDLESIDLFDNYVEEIAAGLPPNLRTLDLSYNRLRRIAYETLPRTLVSLHASYCFLTTHPPDEFRRIVRSHRAQ